jgi:hypothetical protein
MSELDLAICYGSPTETVDHMILHRNYALTPDIAGTLNVGIGDEVFITGLFANYAGEPRNLPIVRVGNLAAPCRELSTSPGNRSSTTAISMSWR